MILTGLVATAGLANPTARAAFAHVFRIQPAVVAKSAPLPVVSTSPLNLGPSLTLKEAQARLSFVIVVPSELGPPDAVYVDPNVFGGQVVLAYKPRAGIPRLSRTGLGLLITEFRGEVNAELLKSIGGESPLEPTTTSSGDPAWWTANTLIWQDEEVTLWIESRLSKDGAMQIASHMP